MVNVYFPAVFTSVSSSYSFVAKYTRSNYGHGNYDFQMIILVYFHVDNIDQKV